MTEKQIIEMREEYSAGHNKCRQTLRASYGDQLFLDKIFTKQS